MAFFVCSLSVVSSVIIGANVLRAWRRSGFRSTKLSASTERDTKHKAPSLHVSPPDAKPVCLLHNSNVRNIYYLALCKEKKTLPPVFFMKQGKNYTFLKNFFLRPQKLVFK